MGPLEAMPSQYATFITLDDASDHPHTRHLEHGAQALILQSLSRFLNSFIDLVLFPTTSPTIHSYEVINKNDDTITTHPRSPEIADELQEHRK